MNDEEKSFCDTQIDLLSMHLVKNIFVIVKPLKSILTFIITVKNFTQSTVFWQKHYQFCQEIAVLLLAELVVHNDVNSSK